MGTMKPLMRQYYNDDGSPRSCWKCGSESFKEVVKDFIDYGISGGGPATEIEYRCEQCNVDVAYWAYGYFDPRYMSEEL